VGSYERRAPEEIMRPRRLASAFGRPLNFTVRCTSGAGVPSDVGGGRFDSPALLRGSVVGEP
jgi:hypothetical protein